METITKRITTKEITQYVVVCGLCGKRIVGRSESQTAFLLIIHKQGKKCKGALK